MMWLILLITAYIRPDDFVLLDEEDYTSVFGLTQENCRRIKRPSDEKKMSGAICDPTAIQNYTEKRCVKAFSWATY